MVYRNDALTVQDALALRPDGIVLSPGPCDPDRAGICLPLVRAAAGPDAAARRVPRPSGDRPGLRRHDRSAPGCRCTASSARSSMTAPASSPACPRPFAATRYHSLIVEPGDPAGRAEGHGGPPTARSWACGTREPADPRRAVPPGKHRDPSTATGCCATSSSPGRPNHRHRVGARRHDRRYAALQARSLAAVAAGAPLDRGRGRRGVRHDDGRRRHAGADRAAS